MLLEQVLHTDLGCASYLVADGGEAIVVDPRWDVDVYVTLAERAGARITHVVDTHHHADHVSGRGRLGRRTGARVHAPVDLQDGDELHAGAVTLRVIATPGHRPEHISLVIEDRGRSALPQALLAGDSLFVGDVARPDLAVDATDGARDVRRSLDRVLALGDHVTLLPGHVAGSLCGGGSLSEVRQSTLGYERRANPALDLQGDTFVDWLAGREQPKPPNLDRIVELNRSTTVDAPPAPRSVGPAEVAALLAGTTVLDVRPAPEFDRGHLAGAINLATSGGIGTRAAQLLNADTPLLVVAGSEARALEVLGLLHAVGLWGESAVTAAEPDAWRAAGLPVAQTHAVGPGEAARRLLNGEVELVDVRDADELEALRMPGSLHLPLDRLRDAGGDVAGRGALVVACARGGRAALAASVLRRHGGREVTRMTGGIADLAGHGIELAAA